MERTPSLTPQTSYTPTCPNDQKITLLEEEHLRDYQDQKILDLSNQLMRGLPDWLGKWLKDHPTVEQINVSSNHRFLGVFLFSNYPSWLKENSKIQLIAHNIGLKSVPRGISPERCICEGSQKEQGLNSRLRGL